jgi:acyl-CoA reductase-like NAD-dependent aldehyde dehydrogenase
MAQRPEIEAWWKVSFTGSANSGAAVAKTAAENVTQVILELGAKNPLVVFDDADIDRVVRDALEGGYFNKGEACTAASRVGRPARNP